MFEKALVVLSGGQDSTTCLFMAKTLAKEVHAISFDYGQVHSIELDAARKVSELAGVTSHELVTIPDVLMSTSPLTNQGNGLEKYTSFEEMEQIIGSRVEKTFVPMRNTFFLTIAANRAVSLGADALVTGICQEDNANYADTTEIYRLKLEQAFQESLRGSAALSILAPLMFCSKADTVRLAYSMPDCWKALGYSHTSYDGKFPPTDNNHSNVLRAHGFEEANLPDPLVVRANQLGLMELPKTPNYGPSAVLEFTRNLFAH